MRKPARKSIWVELIDDGSNRPRVKINLVSGKQIIADKVLPFSAAQGAMRADLEAIGVTTDPHPDASK